MFIDIKNPFVQVRHAEVVLGGGVSGANIINIVSPEKGGRVPWQLDDKKYGCLLKESPKRSIELKGTEATTTCSPTRASEIELKNRCGKISA